MPVFGSRYVPATAHYKHVKKFKEETESRESRLGEWQKQKEARLKKLRSQGFRPRANSVCSTGGVSTVATDVPSLSDVLSVVDYLDELTIEGREAEEVKTEVSWDSHALRNQQQSSSEQHPRSDSSLTSTTVTSTAASTTDASSSPSSTTTTSADGSSTRSDQTAKKKQQVAATRSLGVPGSAGRRRASCYQ